MEEAAHVVMLMDRAVLILWRRLEAVSDRVDLRLGHASLPENAGAEPLRMKNAEMQRAARNRYAGVVQPVAEFHEDIVDEPLVAGLHHQPVDEAAAERRLGLGGFMAKAGTGWKLHGCTPS